MKKNKFSEAQIIRILQEGEAGRAVIDICRQHSIHQFTYYNWKKKYGGMQVQEMQRLKQLEEENRRLKQMYGELSLDHKILKDVIEKKL